jgi:uncharacterized protein (DUF1015 family)
MPRMQPFRGLVYSLERFGARQVADRIRLPGEGDDHPGLIADLSDLACPPYDVIDPKQQGELLERHPNNAVRLELSAEADPHSAAAKQLAAWKADGTLERRAETSVFYYSHARADDPDDLAVQGIVARVLLEPFGAEVRPHEHTMPGPKADRLGLLQATGTQLSPILSVYFDRSERYRHVMSRPWTDEWRARDAEGLLHQVVAVESDERLINYLSRQRLFIADGHHRYETALAYQDEVRSRPEHRFAEPGSLAADWIMMVLVNAELEELEIRATHRVVLDADEAALRDLASGGDALWDPVPSPPEELPARLSELDGHPSPVVGLVLGDEGWILAGRRERIEERMRRERTSTAVRRLDLSVLHAAILADRLGIDPQAVATGDRLNYTRSASDAIARVRRGAAAAAFLVRPTRLDQLAAVAGVGDVMPQKSTYFYPKLLTGMVFNPLED